jgi:precorrin-2/cobalt-factor-2 C20-methyltransferase
MLIGISLGPGDPDLLTFKAAAALKECTKVFAPGEMAANLARPYCLPQLLEFPMFEDQNELDRIWSRNADTVARYAAAGTTGFCCIGDVNTFSTFSHLKRLIQRRHPEIRIDTIPGVGVIPALASRFDASLDRSFEVSDGSDVDTVIRIKATRPKKLEAELRMKGFEEFILGAKLFTAQESIIRGEMPERSDYFSVLLARRRR